MVRRRTVRPEAYRNSSARPSVGASAPEARDRYMIQSRLVRQHREAIGAPPRVFESEAPAESSTSTLPLQVKPRRIAFSTPDALAGHSLAAGVRAAESVLLAAPNLRPRCYLVAMHCPWRIAAAPKTTSYTQILQEWAAIVDLLRRHRIQALSRLGRASGNSVINMLAPLIDCRFFPGGPHSVADRSDFAGEHGIHWKSSLSELGPPGVYAQRWAALFCFH